MPQDPTPELTGEDRCWPCTVANAAVALVVAAVPVLASLARGDAVLLTVAGVWAAGVLGYTGYRLLALGYLPYAGQIARRVGVHERIGPESEDDRGRG